MKALLLSIESFLIFGLRFCPIPMIFDIQRFSLHDGDGIRTLVFFKGCPLRCLWCSNPESQNFGPEVMYDPDRCHEFGDCMEISPGALTRQNGSGLLIDRQSLKDVEAFREVCASRALTVCGQALSTEALLEEILKDAPFYRETGGVTLSGGEPLAHAEETAPLLRELKQQDIRVNVETSLHVPWEKVYAFLPWTDCYLVDLKHTDPLKFRQYTGGDVRLVLDNLTRLADSGARLILRIPVIPGFNHTPEEMKVLLDLAASVKGVTTVHLLPYHAFGANKYRMLGREYPFSHQRPVDEGELESYLAYAETIGLDIKTGG